MTTAEELIAAVRTMRDCQRAYFRGDKRPQMLQLAKAAEARVDRLLEQLDSPTGDLFGPPRSA
jgi:hypothetical protein